MRSLNSMLDEYALSHQNPFNKTIHKLCVPTIMFSMIGLLWLIPTPLVMGDINWATIVTILVMFYYLALSKKYFIFMIPVIGSMYLGNLSWIFQLWGHKVEGKKPSFAKDLLFLLIGPIWVVKAVFKIND
jgi:uncharacterized membrane protein YGL010W